MRLHFTGISVQTMPVDVTSLFRRKGVNPGYRNTSISCKKHQQVVQLLICYARFNVNLDRRNLKVH